MNAEARLSEVISNNVSLKLAEPHIYTIISLNLLHVLVDIKQVLLELKNVLAEGGTISLFTLIETHRKGLPPKFTLKIFLGL
ncbi:MAG: hypothetical protein JRI57_05220 [Deltaproteobacteria bacterium]|nr:hypothetical protein [Deltaproteobacteria bacterium]MBW1953349.1 hypothetical protein [Deltaproteobacteria bacterium]MBW2135066.1 hypothetical protein [Deltaproteobacteria bacterium]